MIAAVLETDGLIWLVVTVLLAGMVRGFTGFGSALIYLPIAGIFLPPAWVIASLTTIGLFGPWPMFPRAWRQARKGELVRLAVAGAVGIPLGVYLLTKLEPTAFRWLVSGISVATLLALASGWRFRGEITAPLAGITGFISGVMGGFVGLSGPPVILLYLSGRKAVEEIRAVILLYLFTTDVVVMTTFWVRDLITLQVFFIGVALVPSYLIGGLIGQRLFDPKRERLFRGVAYAIILIAAVTGLPLFD